jgi:hypothetical protein
MVQTMNATQRRFAVERAKAIINKKREEVSGAEYSTNENNVIRESIGAALRSTPGLVSQEKLVEAFLGTPERPLFPSAILLLKEEPGLAEVVKSAKEKAALDKKRSKDLETALKNFESQIMLGDAAEALKMLSDLEKL